MERGRELRELIVEINTGDGRELHDEDHADWHLRL